MIAISFDEKVKIGLQYALETLHGCSPLGWSASAACGSIPPRSAQRWKQSCTTCRRWLSTTRN